MLENETRSIFFSFLSPFAQPGSGRNYSFDRFVRLHR
jgi:hypothetical protein